LAAVYWATDKETEIPDPASNSYGDLNVLSPDPFCAGVFLPDTAHKGSYKHGYLCLF